MKTLLSVDIDFWNYVPNSEKSLKRYLNGLASLAQKEKIPIIAITNHQQILKIANKSNARRIVNIDTHSDLSEQDVDELNCGTWVNYVKWRGRGEYVWIHKNHPSGGECTVRHEIFPHKGAARKILSRKHLEINIDWKSIKHRCKAAPRPEKFDLSEIVVCMSPDYSDKELIKIFYEWKRQHGIRYLKGRMNESYSRTLTPPKVRFN